MKQWAARSHHTEPPSKPRVVTSLKLLLSWILENQVCLSSTLTLSVVFLHLVFPQTRIHTRKFLLLSYPSSAPQLYTQGIDDIYFVLAWVVNFTAIRAFAIERILRPIAGPLGVDAKSALRFAEQGWLVLYYGYFWTLGMYLWYNSAYWLDNTKIWTGWPAREMSGLFKWYYLAQLAFWFQQILVIHIEKRRKDHIQMLTHHIITCTLISITYVYRCTRAANIVLCLMDVADLLLPIAKILRYLHYETACNLTFCLLVISWFIARHVIYLKLCYDIWVDIPGTTTILFGCYNGSDNNIIPGISSHPDNFAHLLWPFQNLDGIICLNHEVKYIFLSMMLLLQTLSIIWFSMILRIVTSIVMGAKLEDVRSDAEDEGGIDVDQQSITGRGRQTDITDLHLCVSCDAQVVNAAPSRTPLENQIQPVASGRRRLYATDGSKELLNRIGCERPIH